MDTNIEAIFGASRKIVVRIVQNCPQCCDWSRVEGREQKMEGAHGGNVTAEHCVLVQKCKFLLKINKNKKGRKREKSISMYKVQKIA